MLIREVQQDLFKVTDDYMLAHCISADFALGAGIAKVFATRFNAKNLLQQQYPRYLTNYISTDVGGDCLITGRVFNLVTKERYYMKPTLHTIRLSLEKMKSLCLTYNVTKIAMPRIGCGLDKQDWSEVRKIIEDVFAGTSIQILVCSW